MTDEVEELEVITIVKKIRYKDVVWFPEEYKMRSDAAVFKTSAAMVCCWIRFKNVKEFNLSDLKEAFPKWSRYSHSSLLKIINPLIKDKRLLQCPNDVFKVLVGDE